VPHGIWEYAFGYKFTSQDRTIVISGDTGPFDGLVAIARDADVLVHEAYASRGFNQRPAETRRYHGSFHTSATKLGELATAANVGMVILYHQLHLGGESAEEMVEEVRSTYDGTVVYGRDLDVF
jgi:ribonuclease BN (tRNA processing enzyme)